MPEISRFDGIVVAMYAETGTVIWPNDADFDPATLHDVDKVGEAMIATANSRPDAPADNLLTTETVAPQKSAIY